METIPRNSGLTHRPRLSPCSFWESKEIEDQPQLKGGLAPPCPAELQLLGTKGASGELPEALAWLSLWGLEDRSAAV